MVSDNATGIQPIDEVMSLDFRGQVLHTLPSTGINLEHKGRGYIVRAH